MRRVTVAYILANVFQLGTLETLGVALNALDTAVASDNPGRFTRLRGANTAERIEVLPA